MSQPASSSKLLDLLRAIMLSLLIFVPLLLINVMQMISILWKYIYRPFFRRYNSFWGRTYWTYVGWMSQHVGRVKLELSGDPIPPHENALVLANHQSTVDTVIQLMFGRRYRRLGDMKFFVKDILKWVPGPGWGMVFLECIFMKRNWSEDKDRVVKQLRRFKEGQVPIWVNIYPEGTRLKPDKFASAQEFARKAGLPIPQRVLIPRVRGFLATLEGLKGHLDAIYDLTIVYQEAPPTLWDLLSCRGYRVKVEVRRYPVREIPEDEEQRGEWLLALFQAKDKRILELKQSF